MSSGSSTRLYDSNSKLFDIRIPIPGTIQPNIGVGAGGLSKSESVPYQADIYVKNNLKLQISGKAIIEGASISARSLQASFGELLLTSVQDIAEEFGGSFSVSSGLNPTQITNCLQNAINELHGEVMSSETNMIRNLTQLVGRESAELFVARALYLNGAMIANADVDHETGELTDLGNLVLNV